MPNKYLKKYTNASIQLKSGFWFTICGFLQKAISLLCTPIFTRTLSKEEYGITGTFSAWLVIINLIVTLTLYRSVMNLFVKYDDKQKVLSSVCSLSFLVTIIWCLLAIVFIAPLSALTGLSHRLTLCLFFYSIGESIIQCILVYKRYIYDYIGGVLISILLAAISGFGGVFCVIFISKSAEWKIYPQILGYLVIGIALYISLLKNYMVFYDKEIWVFSISFCVGLLPHYFSEFILQSSDKIMIDKLCSSADVATYSIAYAVGSLISIFATAINSSFAPYQYQKIQAQEYKVLSKTANSIMTLLAIIMLVLMLLSKEIVLIFGGTKYLDSSNAIIPICLGVYFNYMYQMFARFQEYYNQKITLVIPSILCAMLNVLLNFIFIRLFGYIAASYTTFICFVLFCLMHYKFYVNTCKKQNNGKLIYDGKYLFLLSITIIIIGAIILIIQNSPTIKYIIIGLLLLLGILNSKKIIAFFKRIYS